jgi:hypothetical protein
MMMVDMHRILNYEARCLSFGSSLPHVFMKLLAKHKCACTKMYTTISLLQLFGFFESAFFMAEQRFFPSLPLPDIPTRRWPPVIPHRLHNYSYAVYWKCMVANSRDRKFTVS